MAISPIYRLQGSVSIKNPFEIQFSNTNNGTSTNVTNQHTAVDKNNFYNDFLILSKDEQKQKIAELDRKGELNNFFLQFKANISDSPNGNSDIDKAFQSFIKSLDADQLVSFCDIVKTEDHSNFNPRELFLELLPFNSKNETLSNETLSKDGFIDYVCKYTDDDTKIQVIEKLKNRAFFNPIQSMSLQWNGVDIDFTGSILSSIKSPAKLQQACDMLPPKQLETAIESTFDKIDINPLNNIITCASKSQDTTLKKQIFDIALNQFQRVSFDQKVELSKSLTDFNYSDKISNKLFDCISTKEEAESFNTFFDGLSNKEANSFIKNVSEDKLKNWAETIFLEILREPFPNEQLELLKPFASKLDGENLFKIYDTIAGDDEDGKRFVASSVIQEADNQVKIDFIEKLDCIGTFKVNPQVNIAREWNFDAYIAANIMFSMREDAEAIKKTVMSMDSSKLNAIINSSRKNPIGLTIIPSYGTPLMADIDQKSNYTNFIHGLINSATHSSVVPSNGVPKSTQEETQYRTFIFNTILDACFPQQDSYDKDFINTDYSEELIIDDLSDLLKTDPINIISCLKQSGEPNDPDDIIPDNTVHASSLSIYMKQLVKYGKGDDIGDLVGVFTDEMEGYWNQQGWDNVNDRTNQNNAENLGYVMGALFSGIISLNAEVTDSSLRQRMYARNIPLPPTAGMTMGRTIIDLATLRDRDNVISANNEIKQELELIGFPTEIRPLDDKSQQADTEHTVKKDAFDAYMEKFGYIIDIIG